MHRKGVGRCIIKHSQRFLAGKSMGWETRFHFWQQTYVKQTRLHFVDQDTDVSQRWKQWPRSPSWKELQGLALNSDLLTQTQERLRQEIGRTVPPGTLLCTGLSPDKEVSGEEGPRTKKICADVENRKWRQLGFSQPPEAGSTGNPAEGQAGQERGPREPPSHCVWALCTVPGSRSPHSPGSQPSRQEALCIQITGVEWDREITAARGPGEPQRRGHVWLGPWKGMSKSELCREEKKWLSKWESMSVDQGMQGQGPPGLKPEVGACHPQQAWGPTLTFTFSAGGWEPWEVCEQEGLKVSVCFWTWVWQLGGGEGVEARWGPVL